MFRYKPRTTIAPVEKQSICDDAFILASAYFNKVRREDVRATILSTVDQMYVVLRVNVTFDTLNETNERRDGGQHDPCNPVACHVALSIRIVPADGVDASSEI